jgi:branched-chain amino acid transport system permease protein
MLSVLVYALAGAVLGGMSSPFGAVAGGILVGLINAILINYLGIVDPKLETFSTLLIVILILLIKPEGLFVKTIARRV